MTTTTRENDLIRRLELQHFRWERKPDGTGITVYAPEGSDLTTLANPTGMVQIHRQSLRSEKGKYIAIEGELKKIGFIPSWDPQPVKESTPDPTEGMELYARRPDPDDPEAKLITIAEAATILHITESGVGQRVKAGKLRAYTMPPIPAAPGVRTWFKLGDVTSQPPKGSRGDSKSGAVATASPVRTRYEDTPAGHIKEAATRVHRLTEKIAELERERDEAIAVITKESDGALTELAETKKRLKDIERWMETGVRKL